MIANERLRRPATVLDTGAVTRVVTAPADAGFSLGF